MVRGMGRQNAADPVRRRARRAADAAGRIIAVVEAGRPKGWRLVGGGKVVTVVGRRDGRHGTGQRWVAAVPGG